MKQILFAELCNGASSGDDVKKETKGSLLAHVGLSSSTSSISGGKWNMRKSWKRKKPLSENILKPNRSTKNGSQTSVINNGSSALQQSSNGESQANLENAPNEVLYGVKIGQCRSGKNCQRNSFLFS